MKKNNLYVTGSTIALLSLPLFVFAQLDQTFTILSNFGAIINLAIGILSALALLVFIWGIVKYIGSAGDEEKAKEGKSIMLYGVLGLFVLFAVWGLVDFLGRELGIPIGQPSGGVRPPSVNF